MDTQNRRTETESVRVGDRTVSDPPTPADLHKLSLDERDLEAIRECTPGDCGLKLSAPEIEALKSAAESGGSRWHEAVQQEFRRLVVARVNLPKPAV